ncbi:MAG: site-specific integrase, partial [Rikenellaceae bacterium]|nr:site-specific integrase [Rikenellaceae bacterium]
FEKNSTKRRWLSKEELERLMKTDFKRASTGFIRDMFLSSTFTGFAYSDLKNLQHSNIQEQKDGSRWIVINRQKTGAASYIPLLEIPLAILEKYRDTKFSGSDGKIFKMRTSVNMSMKLQKPQELTNL